MVVAVQVTGWLILRDVPSGTIHNENVGPAVIVVIDDGDAAARGLDDVLLGVHTPVHILHGESSLLGDVDEPGGTGMRIVRRIGNWIKPFRWRLGLRRNHREQDQYQQARSD